MFLALIDADREPVRRTLRAGKNFERRDGTDRRQGLAAKTERRDLGKIARWQFRRRMALDREGEIVPGHPAAIVDDADEPAAAQFDRDIDAGRTRVERIFDEFLHDGGRPLDDLARRDAVDENRIETTDRHGWISPRTVPQFHAQVTPGWTRRVPDCLKNAPARPPEGTTK